MSRRSGLQELTLTFCLMKGIALDKPKLILVDDDEEFVVALAGKLEKLGFFTRYAFSGHEALDLIQADLYDVAILDVRMPKMDGLALLVEIKSIRPEMEVILLTGYASVQTGVDGMKKGAYDFLIKPANIDVLLARINAAYAKKLAHDELENEKRLVQIERQS